MNKIGKLIQDVYAKLKKEQPADKAALSPSEEKLAGFSAGLLSDEERQAIMDYIAAGTDEEDALRAFILLDKESSGDMAERAPEAVAEKAKQLVPGFSLENALELVVEFAGNVAHIIKNTGTLLTRAVGRDMLPSVVFRDAGAEVAEEAVEVSKTVNSAVVDVKVVRAKKDFFNIIVRIKEKKSGRPLSDARISIMHKGRELMSSLTVDGKVEFQNMEARDYMMYLIRKEGPHCIASLSLRSAA